MIVGMDADLVVFFRSRLASRIAVVIHPSRPSRPPLLPSFSLAVDKLGEEQADLTKPKNRGIETRPRTFGVDLAQRYILCTLRASRPLLPLGRGRPVFPLTSLHPPFLPAPYAPLTLPRATNRLFRSPSTST